MAAPQKTSAILLILALSLISCRYFFDIEADPDLWGHTKFGIEHIANDRLAVVDSYSYTAPGAPWINHEWLAEMAMGRAFLLAADRGLFILRAMVLLAFVALLAALYWSCLANALAVLLVSVFTIPLFSFFLNIRPHLFSYLFVVMVLACLELYREGSRFWLGLLPLIMLFWVNTHGSFVFGLGLGSVGIFVFYLNWEEAQQNPSAKERQLLLAVLLLFWLAPFANPYGAQLFRYLLRAATLARVHIGEWQTITGAQLPIFLGWLLLPLVLLVALRAWQRKTIIIFFFTSAVWAYFNSRFFPLFVIFASQALLLALAKLGPKSIGKDRAVFLHKLDSPAVVFIAALFLAAAALPPALTDYRRTGLRIKVDNRQFPVAAVRFLKQRDLGPNLALPFNWGEYAIWHLSPRYRVSIDGRYETVYPPQMVDRFVEAYYRGEMDGFLGGYPVDVMLLESGKRMDKELGRDRRWQEIYRDDVAAVFVPQGREIAGGKGAGEMNREASAVMSHYSFFP